MRLSIRSSKKSMIYDYKYKLDGITEIINFVSKCIYIPNYRIEHISLETNQDVQLYSNISEETLETSIVNNIIGTNIISIIGEYKNHLVLIFINLHSGRISISIEKEISGDIGHFEYYLGIQ